MGGHRPGELRTGLKLGNRSSGSEKPNVGRGRAQRKPETRRVIAGKSKWRVKLVRLPEGGEGSKQASAGTNTRRGRKAQAAARRWGQSNGRFPSPPPVGPGSGARAGGHGRRSFRALPRTLTLTFQVRQRPSSLQTSGTSAPRDSRCGTRKN
jgi:hypothetical protein